MTKELNREGEDILIPISMQQQKAVANMMGVSLAWARRFYLRRMPDVAWKNRRYFFRVSEVTYARIQQKQESMNFNGIKDD